MKAKSEPCPLTFQVLRLCSGSLMRISAPTRWPLTVALLLLVLAGGLAAQMRPDAPIRNFRFPVFNDDGWKMWELRGVEGRFLTEDRGLILGLDLLVFSGDATLTLENRIRSPQALIDFEAKTAEGESTLFVTGPGYEIEGAGWHWDGIGKRMLVSEGARVVFQDSLQILQ